MADVKESRESKEEKKDWKDLKPIHFYVLAVVGSIAIFTWKMISILEGLLELSTIDNLNQILALVVAYFAIIISALFYFKSTENSNEFYNNTYRFTKDVTKTLTEIKSEFGEKLQSIEKKTDYYNTDKITSVRKIPINFEHENDVLALGIDAIEEDDVNDASENEDKAKGSIAEEKTKIEVTDDGNKTREDKTDGFKGLFEDEEFMMMLKEVIDKRILINARRSRNINNRNSVKYERSKRIERYLRNWYHNNLRAEEILDINHSIWLLEMKMREEVTEEGFIFDLVALNYYDEVQKLLTPIGRSRIQKLFMKFRSEKELF